MSKSALRDQLFEAAASGNWQRMYELCAEHSDAIRKNFATWKQVPEDLRDDDAQLEKYVDALFRVADFFASELKDDSLREALTGRQKTTPVQDLESQIREVQELMANADYDRAQARIDEGLKTLRGLEVENHRYLPILYGSLGECRFHSGRVQDAVAPLTRALTLCEAAGDLEGVAAYLGSLHEVHRYLGNRVEAVDYATRLADLLEEASHPGGAHYRKRAGRMTEGEALNRVVMIAGTATIELDERMDVPPDGRFRFAFERNRIGLGAVQHLVNRGRGLGRAGEFSAALECFQEAAELDPHDPDPWYQQGVCYLDLGNSAEAISAFAKTEELAPGWFHCRGDLWLAEQLSEGRYSESTIHTIRLLEDGQATREEQESLGKLGVERCPELGLMWLLYGEALLASDKAKEATEAFEMGLRHVEHDDHRTRLLTALGNAVSDHERKLSAWTEAMRLEGNLLASAMARVMLTLTARPASDE